LKIVECRKIKDNYSSIDWPIVQGLQQFVAFAETAKHGGFAAASRALGVTPSTLAKAVGRLEAELNVRLFHRTTRQVKLTPDGQRLFHRCQRVLTEVEDLQAEASGTHAEPSGTLCINMPVFYGKRFVLPILSELAKKYPKLTLDLRFNDRRIDLVQEKVDLAIRIGSLSDPSLVARRVDRQQLLLCASASYLKAHGAPRRIEQLAEHKAIAFRMPHTGRERLWEFRQRRKPVELLPTAQTLIDDTESLVDALKLGAGLCQLPDHLVQNELTNGKLIELLPDCRPPPMPISVVYATGRLLPARVRVVIDALDVLRQRSKVM
jgi:LysR family transcriptional regulator, regulator for bpeEF and oprC